MTSLYHYIKPNQFSVFAFALRSVFFFATKSKDTWLDYKSDHTVCNSAPSNYLTPFLIAKAYVSFLIGFLCRDELISSVFLLCTHFVIVIVYSTPTALASAAFLTHVKNSPSLEFYVLCACA